MFLKTTCSMETFFPIISNTERKANYKEKLAKYKNQNLFGKTKLLFVHNLTTKSKI